MINSFNTDFQNPEQVVLDFIKSSYEFCKECPIGPKGDDNKCIKKSLQIVHYYTYIKFNKYNNYNSYLSNVKNIKEIDSTEQVNNNQIIISTRKNKSIIPVCEFILVLKNKKWKILKIRIKQGENNYYSILG